MMPKWKFWNHKPVKTFKMYIFPISRKTYFIKNTKKKCEILKLNMRVHMKETKT